MNIPIHCENCRSELKARWNPTGIVVTPCECKGEEEDDSESFAHSPEENGVGLGADEIRDLKAMARVGGWRV